MSHETLATAHTIRDALLSNQQAYYGKEWESRVDALPDNYRIIPMGFASAADVTELKTIVATLTANDVKQQEQLAQQQTQLEALEKQMESLKRQATRMESLMGDFTLGW